VPHFVESFFYDNKNRGGVDFRILQLKLISSTRFVNLGK